LNADQILSAYAEAMNDPTGETCLEAGDQSYREREAETVSCVPLTPYRAKTRWVERGHMPLVKDAIRATLRRHQHNLKRAWQDRARLRTLVRCSWPIVAAYARLCWAAVLHKWQTRFAS
jgi:hypothetical protein